MHDYMRALQSQFFTEPESKYKTKIETLHKICLSI